MCVTFMSKSGVQGLLQHSKHVDTDRQVASAYDGRVSVHM